MTKEFKIFHNRLRILICMDRDEFGQAAGYGDTRNSVPNDVWRAFCYDPYKWFIHADTEKSKGVFKHMLDQEK